MLFACALFAMLFTRSDAQPFTMDAVTLQWADSLFNTTENQTEIRTIGRNPETYCAASFKTLPYSFDTVAAVILDYPRYAEIFTYMNKFSMLKNGRKYSDFGSAYFEVGPFFAYFWTLAQIDSVIYKQDTTLRVRVHQIADSLFTDTIRKSRSGGFIVFEVKNYGFRWYCEAIGKDSTRVGFITWLTPDNLLPGWIYRLGGRIIVPQMLQDLSREIRNNRFITPLRRFEN
jgi:hypothetical protein